MMKYFLFFICLFPVTAFSFNGITSNFLYWNLHKESESNYLFSYGLSSLLFSDSSLSELNNTKKDFLDREFNDYSHFIKIVKTTQKKNARFQYELSLNKSVIVNSTSLVKVLKDAGEFQLLFQVDSAPRDPIWFRFKKETSTHIRLISTSQPMTRFKDPEVVLINKLIKGKRLMVLLPNQQNKIIVDAIFSLRGFTKAMEYFEKE